MLSWELIGAVVGAGMASGREIAAFFTQYGCWSHVGIFLAVMTMLFLVDTPLPVAWEKRWPEKLWSLLLAMLLVATGGAMLSGAGEIAALTLPVHGAYWLGMAITLALAWRLAHRTIGGLAWVSRVMLAVFVLMLMVGFTLKPMPGMPIPAGNLPRAVLYGAAYGGFNAALQTTILKHDRNTRIYRKRAIFKACMLLFVIILMGNAVLLRHSSLQGKAMPFMQMLMQFGRIGYYLGAICLYLAILSTLTACLKGLGNSAWKNGLVCLAALVGFSGVVEFFYPMLGIGFLCVLTAAKCWNYVGSSFHS